MRETLDETLDRVANQITAVPQDATFVARLRPHLDASGRQLSGLHTLIAATCVLALAVGLMRSSDPGTRRSSPIQTASARPAAPPAQTARSESEPVDRQALRATTTDRATAAVPRSEIEHTVAVSAIPALPAPPIIDLAHLQLDGLVVEPVEVSSIEIPEISVADLRMSEEPKE